MKFDDFIDDRLKLQFKLRNELIYYTNFDNKRERLYMLGAGQEGAVVHVSAWAANAWHTHAKRFLGEEA